MYDEMKLKSESPKLHITERVGQLSHSISLIGPILSETTEWVSVTHSKWWVSGTRVTTGTTRSRFWQAWPCCYLHSSAMDWAPYITTQKKVTARYYYNNQLIHSLHLVTQLLKFCSLMMLFFNPSQSYSTASFRPFQGGWAWIKWVSFSLKTSFPLQQMVWNWLCS